MDLLPREQVSLYPRSESATKLMASLGQDPDSIFGPTSPEKASERTGPQSTGGCRSYRFPATRVYPGWQP